MPVLWGGRLISKHQLLAVSLVAHARLYDKPNAPQEIWYLQRWCNNKFIFKSEPDFKNYDPKRG